KTRVLLTSFTLLLMQFTAAQESFFEQEIYSTRLELKEKLDEIKEVKLQLQKNLNENTKDSIHNIKELPTVDGFEKTMIQKKMELIRLHNKNLKKSLQELEYYEGVIESLLSEKKSRLNNSTIG